MLHGFIAVMVVNCNKKEVYSHDTADGYIPYIQ